MRSAGLLILPSFTIGSSLSMDYDPYYDIYDQEPLYITSVPAISRSWIWGPSVPSSSLQRFTDSLSDAYPDHGFIQLRLDDDTLTISLVKRPPAIMWPPENKFCSRMLPAAINEFFSESVVTGINDINSVMVSIVADPHIAACKCYVRTLLAMGMDRLRMDSNEPVTEAEIDAFCADEPDIILARPSIGGPRLPPVTMKDMTDLASAHFHLVGHDT